MSLFGTDNSFVIFTGAFKSEDEVTQTIIHELQRLSSGKLGGLAEAAGWAGRAASVSAGAVPLTLIPTNTQADLHPLGEGLQVRTAPGQRSATVQRRVDDGLLGTGIGARWIDLPVAAEWSTSGPNRQRVIAIDRQGLEQVIGRDAADAALGGNGIAMAKPPSKDEPAEQEEPGPGHNSEAFGEKLGPEPPEPGDEDPKPPLNPVPLVLRAIQAPERVQSRINLRGGSRSDGTGWDHIVYEHFNPARTGKSQFTISQAELRELLQTREVVRSPIVRILQSEGGPRYIREVTLGERIIGTDVKTKSPTSTLTVMTDTYGNLVTAFPGRMR